MKLIVCITTLVLLVASSRVHRSRSNFIKFWEWSAIKPDVIDHAPSQYLKVYYPSGVKANLVNELTPTEVKDQPYVSWEADDAAHYTLMLVNPDAPSPQHPLWAEILHWLIVNIPGNEVGKGQTLWEFIGSAPAKGTCLHRYALLVFEQKEWIYNSTFVSKTSLEGRVNASTRKFIEEFQLNPKPVAGNSYRAQYDDYTPVIYNQVGGIPPYEKEQSCPKY